MATAMVMLLGVLAAPGCGSDSSHDDHDDDHIGHVIPAHKPKTFPEAVRRLHDLNESIGRPIANRRQRGLPDAKTVTIALDIAKWLPELAAESDMPEEPWNSVNADSEILVSHYEKVLNKETPGGTDDGESARGAGRAIADLESLLARADRRWFQEPGQRGGAS